MLEVAESGSEKRTPAKGDKINKQMVNICNFIP